jgi:hypothetical protein
MMPHVVEKATWAAHKLTDFTGYVAGGGGLVIAALGAVDANAAQAWVGALVACVAAVWGLYRDQKAHDRQDAQRKKDEARHDAWDTYITQYRIKKIEATGRDPFARGTPPLDFLESAAMAEIDKNDPAKTTEEIAAPKVEPKPESHWPRWPSIHHLFG